MSKKDEKKSFVMYDSFLSAMKHLNDAEFRECVLKIRDYALGGTEEESESPMVNVIMELAKPNLDSAKRRYMASVENGRRGAEFGKLGGAPKGNQNARKNNPQSTPKQPLDVDVNADVEDDVNENEEVDVNINVDVETYSGSILSNSSFSNSSNSSFSKEVVSSSEGETSVYSKNRIKSNSASTGIEGEAKSVARPRRREVKGGVYDQSEYYRLCLDNFVLDLADMRKGILPNDGNLFWQAVNLHKSLYGCSEQQAVSTISSKVSEIVQRDS